MILNNIFDKIYCLHCCEDKKRESHIISQFNKLGIDFDMWWACRHPNGDAIITAINHYNRGQLTKPNEFNCTREHYSIIKQAYERGFEKILIFEDDIWLLNDINIWNNMFESLPDDWDILRLGGLYEEPMPFNRNILFQEHKYWVKRHSNIWSTAGYALTRKGMKYYIDFMDSLYVPADGPFCEWFDNSVNMYICTKPLIYQYEPNFESTIRDYERLKVFNYYNGIDKNEYI